MPGTRFCLLLGVLLGCIPPTNAAPSHLVNEYPVSVMRQDSGVIVVDFGRVAFANVKLLPPAAAAGEITVHFGEAFANGRIDRDPPGTVRYHNTTVKLDGETPVVAAPPACNPPRNWSRF